MPAPIRRHVPNDGEPSAPSQPASGPPDPADFPLAMAIGKLLSVIAAVSVSLVILLLLFVLTDHEREGTSNLAAALFSLPLITTAVVSAGIASAVYQRCGARRRAVVLGVAAAAVVAPGCATCSGFF